MFKATSISPLRGMVSTGSHRSGFMRVKQMGLRATSILNTRASIFDQLIRITLLVSLPTGNGLGRDDEEKVC
jgi:hypothetical protein